MPGRLGNEQKKEHYFGMHKLREMLANLSPRQRWALGGLCTYLSLALLDFVVTILRLNVENWAQENEYDKLYHLTSSPPASLVFLWGHLTGSFGLGIAVGAIVVAFAPTIWKAAFKQRTPANEQAASKKEEGAIEPIIDSKFPPEIRTVIDKQDKLIEHYVRAYDTSIRHNLEAHEPYIDLKIVLENLSTFTLMYEGFEGRLFFRDDPFGSDVKMESYTVSPIKHFGAGEFTLRQFIGPELRDLLSRNDDFEIELAPSNNFAIKFSFSNHKGDAREVQWKTAPRMFRIIKEAGRLRFSID